MWIRTKNDLTLITCRVHPNAKQDALEGLREDQLYIRLKSPPVEGRANKALVAFLAARLGLAKSRCTVVHGLKNRVKVVAVEGLSVDEVCAALGITRSD